LSSKIVVTGIGATTPLGGDAQTTWKALLAGESGITAMDQEWVARYELPVTFAGQAKVKASEILTLQETKRLDPSSQFALIAAREAWADAGVTDFDPERLSVEFATGIGGVWTLLDAYDTLKEKGPRRVLPMTVPMLMPNGPAAAIGMDISARGGVRTSVSACASGTEAIANAITRLRSGEIDIVVAGGCEAAMHFQLLLSHRCMPFQDAMTSQLRQAVLTM
jgi:3-oxoacyl-[acyl-carrier-protein] synthase II